VRSFESRLYRARRRPREAKQWVLSGTVAPETTMTAILNADTFVPEEIQRPSTDAKRLSAASIAKENAMRVAPISSSVWNWFRSDP
jgi:hypothetical protein